MKQNFAFAGYDLETLESLIGIHFIKKSVSGTREEVEQPKRAS